MERLAEGCCSGANVQRPIHRVAFVSIGVDHSANPQVISHVRTMADALRGVQAADFSIAALFGGIIGQNAY
jgi:hypothetical protein